MPPRPQGTADDSQEVAEPHRVGEHVIANNEIERFSERDAEAIEVDQVRRFNAMQLADDELLTFPKGHSVDMRTELSPKPVKY